MTSYAAINTPDIVGCLDHPGQIGQRHGALGEAIVLPNPAPALKPTCST